MLLSSLGRDLMEAARRGDVETVRRLLDLGISASFQGRGGWHALHMAAMGGHEMVVRELLDRSFPVDLPNDVGSTALAEVVHQIGELALSERGVSSQLAAVHAPGGAPDTDIEERLYGVLQQLLERGADPEAGRTREGTPLALAQSYGVERVRAILDRHAHRRR